MNQIFGESVRQIIEWLRFATVILSRLSMAAVAALLLFTFVTWAAAFYVTNPVHTKVTSTPADSNVLCEEVYTTTSDDIELVAWFLPGWNGATVIAQHGYRGNRESLLFEGIALNERGYNVLLTTSRAHDQNKGGQITFGAHEMKDLEAWYQYLLTRTEVDPDKIGIMGESMGGGMAILYAAQNDNIKTVATASAFTLSAEAVENFIFQDVARPGPVAPIFAQMMVYWAETNANFNSANLDTARAVAEIGPRPILILHGGQDKVVSPRNGMELSEAAGGTAQFEIFPNVEHCTFDEVDPDHYVEILADFFDRSLLAT